MSTSLAQPAQTPASIRTESPERWQRASERAQLAQVIVTAVDDLGTYRVTSASHPGVSYESDGIHCTCQAAGLGDPVCLHRAAVRAHRTPEPDPPAHQAYDPDAKALQWAYNDRDRAHRDLDRYNALLARDGALSERDYRGFRYAQEREQDASERIGELTARRAQKAPVAA